MLLICYAAGLFMMLDSISVGKDHGFRFSFPEPVERKQNESVWLTLLYLLAWPVSVPVMFLLDINT